MSAASKFEDRLAHAELYRPLPWVQVTGFDVDKDAQYTASLSDHDPYKARARQRQEIKRLAHFHGDAYARKVQDRVIAIFREAG